MAEPTRVEVLAWMERTGGTPSAAVDHFWPGLGDPERSKWRSRVKQWAHRARAGASERPTATPPASRTSSTELGARLDASRSPATAPEDLSAAGDTVPRAVYLRQQLARLEFDIELARTTGQLRLVPQLNKQITDVRAQLDAALEPERRVLKLERTATAVAAEILRRAKALELRAEIERRRVGSCSPT